MAEFVMKHLIQKANLKESFYIDSAGTSREELGNPPHYGTVRKLKSVGISVGTHYARQINESDFEEFDLIICMDSYNMRYLKRVAPEDCQNKLHLLLEYVGLPRDIADPWYTGNFDDTYNDVLRGCTALLEEIQR